MKRNGKEVRCEWTGPLFTVPFIGSSGGGIAQVVHRSAVEQVVTLTAGVTVAMSTPVIDQWIISRRATRTIKRLTKKSNILLVCLQFSSQNL